MTSAHGEENADGWKMSHAAPAGTRRRALLRRCTGCIFTLFAPIRPPMNWDCLPLEALARDGAPPSGEKASCTGKRRMGRAGWSSGGPKRFSFYYTFYYILSTKSSGFYTCGVFFWGVRSVSHVCEGVWRHAQPAFPMFCARSHCAGEGMQTACERRRRGSRGRFPCQCHHGLCRWVRVLCIFCAVTGATMYFLNSLS